MSDGTMFADGFKSAIAGYASRAGEPVLVVYDYDKCVDLLMMRDDMEYSDAVEYMEFNVVNAYHGEGTPVFLHPAGPDEVEHVVLDS